MRRDEEGRHQKIGGLRDVDMAEDGESQLDGAQDKGRDTTTGGRKRSPRGIILNRQRKWLGHIMKGPHSWWYSLLRTIIEERMGAK